MSIKNKIFKTLNISRVSGVPCLYLSNPGVGKTTIIYDYAKMHNHKVTELRGSTSSPEDILGYYVNEGGSSLTIKYPKWFLNIIEDGEKGVPHLLFIDELTTVSKSVQAALLKIIFDREIIGIKLPDTCLIVAAGNYASNLANSFGIITPILNRFCILNLIPDENTYIQYVYNKKEEKDDMLFPKTLINIDSDTINDKVAIYIKNLIRKYSNQKESPSIINLENTDYSAVDNVEGVIFGIMTPRTVSYLSRMVKASIQLGYTEDLSCIPLGLIGFGTGNIVDNDILKGYHNFICSNFNNIIKNNSSEDGLTTEISNLNQKSDELILFMSDLEHKLKSPLDYIIKINNIKEALMKLDNAIQYTTYNVKVVKNSIMHLANALMHIHNVICIKGKDNKIFTKYINGRYNDVHNYTMDIIIRILTGDRYHQLIKNSDEIANLFKEDYLTI